MQAASLSEIKRELSILEKEDILQICLRLGRFKKDNKELLTYLLFEAGDEAGYIASLQAYIDEAFLDMNTSSLYLVKKSLRKVLRNITRMIRYSGNKQTEAEVLIYFCKVLLNSSIRITASVQLVSLYERQLVKIEKALKKLHEDLQADYQYELTKLTLQ